MEVSKMKTISSSKKLVLVSLLFALATCTAFYWYLQGEKGALQEVVVVKQAIPAYSQIKKEALQVKKMPAEYIPPTAVQTLSQTERMQVKKMPAEYIPPTAVQTLSQTERMVTSVPLAPGDILVAHHLTRDKTQGGLAHMIPPQHRAMTMAVDEVSGVARMIQPGNYVDVLAYLKKENVGNDMEETLLQKKLVLAVDQTVQQSPGKKAADKKDGVRTITLAVTPNEAQQLGLVQEIGNVCLILRPQDEDSLFQGTAVIPAAVVK